MSRCLPPALTLIWSSDRRDTHLHSGLRDTANLTTAADAEGTLASGLDQLTNNQEACSFWVEAPLSVFQGEGK